MSTPGLPVAVACPIPALAAGLPADEVLDEVNFPLANHMRTYLNGRKLNRLLNFIKGRILHVNHISTDTWIYVNTDELVTYTAEMIAQVHQMLTRKEYKITERENATGGLIGYKISWV